MKRTRLFVALAAVIFAWCLAAPRAHAANLSVTTTADSGAGSLRAVVTGAAAGDTITFSSSVFSTPQTITLTTGQIEIVNDLTIVGPGARLVTISGNNNSRIFLINDGNDSANKNVSISGLTFTQGNGSGETVPGGGTSTSTGGAIFCQENLTLRGCTLSGNSTSTTSGGGIVLNIGTSLVDACTISGNTVNPAGSNGGGLFISAASHVTVQNSTISGNTTGNSGGGAIVQSSATATFKNCTIVGNTANGANGGGGLRVSGTGPLNLINCIVAGNTCVGLPSGNDLQNSSSTLTGNNNVIGDAGSSAGLTNGTNGNIVGNGGSGVRALNTIINTTLANNGGPTNTHLVAAGSVAIDAGSNAAMSTAASDQRGLGFNRFNGTIDIGAVESGVSAPTFTNVAPLGVPAQINNSTTLAFTVPPGNDRVLVVAASASSTTAASDITQVTFNGTPMTLGVKKSDGTNAVDGLYYLALGNSTTAATGNVVMTISGSGATATSLGAMAFQNANQSTPMTGGVSANNPSGSNLSSSLNVTSVAGDLVIDLFDIYDTTGVGTQTPGAGQVVLHNIDAPSGNLWGYYQTSLKPGAATTTMSWTSNGASMIHVAANIKQVPPSGTTVTSLNRANATPSNAATVNWTLTFPTAVTGVTASNFSLSGGAAAGASVGTPTTGNGGVTWNVPVTTGSSSGTLTLTMQNSSGTTPTVTNVAFAGETYTMDKTAPTVTMTSAAANPTNVSPIPVTVTFSESVTGFIASDITAANGTVSNFAGSGAIYTFDLVPSGQGLVTANIAAGVAQDSVGNGNTAATQFSRTFDSAAPTVTMTSAAANPTNTSPISVTVTFSETVTGFAVGDITAGNGTVSNFVTNSGSSYSFDLTPSGQGSVTANIAAGVAQDAAGNNNTAATQFSRTFDTVAPTVSMTSAAGNPTNTSPIPVTVTFSESITGFIAGDITASNATVSGFTGSGASYSFNLVPSGQGTVTANIAAGVAQDVAGNNNMAATQFSRTFDTVAPTVTMTSAAPNPTNTSPIPVTVTFSESVTGFIAGDITTANATVSGFTGSGASYSFNLVPSGQGLVTANIAAGVAQDAAGNNNTAATQFSRTYDSVAPAVTINQAGGQPDPASAGPINFTVVFNESVTGFTNTDVTLSGTAGATTANVTGGPATYNVAVSGMTGNGTVIATVVANAAQDAAGNNSAASTSTDNTVTYSTAPASDIPLTLSGGNLIVDASGSSAASHVVIRFATGAGGPFIEVFDPTRSLGAGAGMTQVNPNTVRVPVASVTGFLSLIGSNFPDAFTLDFTNGDVCPPGGISVNGGLPNTPPGDALIVDGDFSSGGVYGPSGPGAGTLTLDSGNVITFAGLEPLDLSAATFPNFTVQVDPGNTFVGNVITTVTAVDGGVNTLISFSGGLESVKLGTVTGALNIDGDNVDNDYFALRGVGTAMAGDFVVDGQGGDVDVVDIYGGTIALAAGKNLSLKADFIGLGMDAGGTNIGTLNVSGNLTLEANGDSAVTTPPIWGSGGVWGTSIPAYFSPAALFTQRGSIQMRGLITKTAGADATAVLRARAGVGFMNASSIAGTITSTSNKLNVVIHADSDANNDGSVQMQNLTALTTNGGDVTIGGGADPATGPAVGVAGGGATAGVLINNVTITTAGGNVSIRGKGFAGNAGFGVFILASAASAGQPTINTAAGNLTIVGTGNGTAGASTGSPGVQLAGLAGSPSRIPQLLTTTGAINVTGTATIGNNTGILINNNATIGATGAAPIILTGTSSGSGNALNFSAAAINVIQVTSEGGNVTLVGDTLVLDAGLGTRTFQTSGAGIVTAKPLTVGRAINVGGADSPTELGLNLTELASFTASTVTIGDSNSGPITVTASIAPATFTTLALGNNTTFSATGGFSADVTTAAAYEKVTVAGTLTIAAGATFTANSVGGYVWNGTDTFTFVANDDVDAVSGAFTGPTLTNFLGSALTAQQSYVGGTGNDFVVGLGVPSVTGVDPATAGTTGGTTITITGSGFTGATGVTIGGAPATGVNVVNDTTITVVVPAGTLGTAAIVVTGPAGTGTGSGLFTYVPPPTLTLDRATVTVNEGGTASNSGVFGGVPGDTITISASSGAVTQSPNGVWTFQQAFAVGGHPGDPALDNDGNLYVVLGQEKEVLKFNSAGTLVATFSFTFEPGGIAIDNANGIVYVTALTGSGSDKVYRYSLAGVEFSSFGASGTGDGQLSTPYNIAIDPVGGNLYVVDKGNSRIQVFTPAGDFVRKWGSFGTGDGQFNFPQGIRVSTDGKVYVTDRNNNRIQYFDLDGNYLGQWGSAGGGNGQFSSPTGISIDPSGNTYVSDLLNNRIQKFTATGGYLDQFGPGSGPGALNLPHGVAFPDNGRSLYVVNYGAANVVKYSTPGTWVWSADAEDGPDGPTPVTITATDSTNGTSTQQVFSFTINNVAPAIALTGNATVTVGASYTLNLGDITDPGADEVTDFEIDWGEGAPESFSEFPLGTKNHTYATLGPKTIRVKLTDEDSTFSNAGTLTITVLPPAGPPAVNDAVTTGTGPSVVYPLANDPTTDTTIVSVSNPAITISADGRSLQVPQNFTGSFTYTTSAGNTATVDVTAGTPVSAPRKYTGLLYDNTGALAGLASLSVSSRGSASVQVRVGTTTGRAVFSFNSTTATASTSTALGAVTLTRNADGTLAAALAATGGSLTGTLFPAPTVLTPVKYHVALASIDDTVPGGGILRVTLTSRGQVRLVATLPDGRPISVGAGVTDNGTVIFYGKESSRVSPPGVIGGQLVPANLALTDLTGEILWNKPPQAQGSGGTQQAGVDTILVANGSIYAGALPPGMTNLAGTGTITLSGGGFAVPEVDAVTLAGAIPTTPVGSLRNWAGVKVDTGMFRCRIQVPGITKPVTGSGLYLPKSNSAWGYFPGAALGGRVELTAP